MKTTATKIVVSAYNQLSDKEKVVAMKELMKDFGFDKTKQLLAGEDLYNIDMIMEMANRVEREFNYKLYEKKS